MGVCDDLISRQAVIDAVRQFYDEFSDNEKSIEEIIADLPSAQDVVEVVQCKDCVHHKNAPQTMYVWCECVDGLLPCDWFCADGERRESCTQ